MSIKLMTAAWASDLATGPKMVLLALCDNASDEGICWPSIPTLSKKCSMGQRTVQGHIAALQQIGAVERHDRPGKLTGFRVDPRRFCTPADSAPPQKTAVTPADFASAYIGESSKNLNTNTRKAAPRVVEVEPIEGVDQQTWADYAAMRVKRKSPATATSNAVLVREATKAGITLQEAVETCCARGWLSVKADWFAPRAAASGAFETPYQRSMREKASAFAPGIARRDPNQTFEGDPYGPAIARH